MKQPFKKGLKIMSNTNLYKATLKRETEKAICVSFGAELFGESFNFKNVWFPKSLLSEIKIEETKISFEAPEWLMFRKVKEYCENISEMFSNVRSEVKTFISLGRPDDIDWTWAI